MVFLTVKEAMESKSAYSLRISRATTDKNYSQENWKYVTLKKFILFLKGKLKIKG